MAPRVVDKEAKRWDILMAAMRVFCEKGYHPARMQEVASEAGIGKGTIYEYFSSKEDLLLGIYDAMRLDFEKTYAAHAFVATNGLSRVLESLEILFTDIENYADLVPLFFETLGSQRLNERLGLTRKMADWMDEMSDFYAEMIRAGQKDGSIRKKIDAKALARMLISLIDGFVLHCNMFSFDKNFLNAQMQELKKIIEYGLKA